MKQTGQLRSTLHVPYLTRRSGHAAIDVSNSVHPNFLSGV